MSVPASRPDDAARETSPTPWTLVLYGALIGFAASWCGIGGGLFAVPILHFGRGLPLKRAVATGLVLVLATALAATTTELLGEAPDLAWTVLVPLVCGVLLGAPLGFRALERLPVPLLRRAFVLVLAIASWRMWQSGARPPADLEAFGLLDGTVVFCVGLGGGFLSPLLGVGGGLLMVPGLYLLADTGFELARASSLCAAVFGASRSLRMHAVAGRVVWPAGLRLGGGALLGAAAGVRVLTSLELVEVARRGFAVLLLLVALRFLRDALRRSSNDDPS